MEKDTKNSYKLYDLLALDSPLCLGVVTVVGVVVTKELVPI